MALGKTLFLHDRRAQLTEGLASHSVGGATAARLLGPFLLRAHPRAALSPAEWETWGGWGGTCSVNTGAQVLGAPSVTTGLLGSVCWLGPELAGGGCHHRTASQSAAARGGLYPSRGSEPGD